MKVLDLDSKEMVELSQGQVFVLHLSPCVLGGMNRAVDKPRRAGRKLGEVLMPCKCHIYQLVEEETLNSGRLKY